MILIAHRGNLSEKMPENENRPEYIEAALKAGYEAEVDVWLKNEEWWLGHDEPQYKITDDFFHRDGLWCHAKNIIALQRMLEKDIHCFWHETDAVTLTSRGFMWSYPGQELTNRSICVMPEESGQIVEGCIGICSDFVAQFT